MSHSQIERIRCFLCREYNSTDKPHKSIDGSHCPASKKEIKCVLLHLARAGKFELHIEYGEWLCPQCYIQIVEYDTSLVDLMMKQKNLITLVDKAATSFDSDIEAECLQDMDHMEELSDEHFSEDIFVSDQVIAGTIFEAMGGKIVTKKMLVVNRHLKNSCQKRAVSPLSEDDCDSGERIKESIQCNLCAMRFNNRNLLQKHLKNVHKKISCTMCSFSHRNEDYVMLHMNLHEGKIENQCRYCNKQFTTKSSTIRHMEVHLDTKKYQCDKCGLCFSQTTMLYTHKLQHEAEENPLGCEICNQTFKTIRTYRHHMVTHRADRPRHTCEYCGKTFTERYTLKVHKRIHPEASTQSGPDSAKESQCVDNVQKEQYTLHQEQHSSSLQQTEYHGRSQKSICIICDQQFANKELLDKHMEKQHDVILKTLQIESFEGNAPKRPRQIRKW